MTREADLYLPIKTLLESKGYQVKAEINGCDVVAVKPGEPDILVELKLSLSLELVLQGVDRLAISDTVYLAVHAPDTPAKRRHWKSRRRGALKLCRMLGLGLILVDPKKDAARQTDVLVEPGPYQPRKNARRRTRLKAEFETRLGDPNTGGITRSKIITAYRQDAIRCAGALSGQAELNLGEIRNLSGVSRAGAILQKNHYGWFERQARGIYRLSHLGRAALEEYRSVLQSFTSDGNVPGRK